MLIYSNKVITAQLVRGNGSYCCINAAVALNDFPTPKINGINNYYIFDNVEFFQKRYNLDVGDIIVIVSDGVIDSKRNVINKEFWVSSFLRELGITDPKIIAEELLEKTIDNYNGDIKDDISIIVTKISE